MPWEKEIYVNLLVQFLEEEQKRMRDQEAKSKILSRFSNDKF